MKMFGPIQVLEKKEEDLIHQTMLRIIDEVGMVIENKEMLERLSDFGGMVDTKTMTVRFSPSFVEEFIASSEKFDWDNIKPEVIGNTCIAFGYYLEPETNRYELWSIDTILRYLKVAHYLEHTNGTICYTFPIEGVKAEAELLFSHYLAFKVCGVNLTSLNDIKWCPHILEMWETVIQEKGGRAVRPYSGHIHLIPPLKIARDQTEIFLFFANRGIKINIYSMVSMGGSAPVTLAGALSQYLAELIFIHIIKRTYYDERKIFLGGAIAPMDMKTMMYPYTRPENEMCNIAMAQMARRYSTFFGTMTGFSDAKCPSAEAGFQRALNSIPTLMTTGRASIACGELSVDDVYSPIQMIIDDEIVSMLKCFIKGFEVNEETLAFDVIKQVGPGGNFLETDHTLRHFRKAHWQPKIFSREMYGSWIRSGAKTDVKKALEIYRDIMQRPDLQPQISQETEQKLLKIIHKATGTTIRPVSMEVRQ